MTIHIENEVEATFDFEIEPLITSVVNEALDFEGCPYEASVEVVLTDDASIQEVNQEYRSMDKSTDVLSFPMAFYETPADFDGLEDQDDVFDPDTGEYMLGDIMISVEHVRAQAKEFGHSEKRELAFLVAHSMLHLMGYDHMEEDERKIMEEKQNQILNNLGITREA